MFILSAKILSKLASDTKEFAHIKIIFNNFNIFYLM